MTDVSVLTAGSPSKGGSAGLNVTSHLVSGSTDPDTDEPYSIDEGMPVTPNPDEPDADIIARVIKARANDVETAVVLGLAVSAGEAPASVAVRYAGPVTLTTAQWDAVTGDTGGLTPNAIYYLSAANAGQLTTTPPTGPNYVMPIGFASSATTMMLQVGLPVVGGG